MLCSESEGWASCSVKVKQAIEAASTPQEAFAAAEQWAIRYDRLYLQHASAGWTATDQSRMQQVNSTLFDETIGKYVDPAAVGLGRAMEKYFPRLAAILGLASSPVVIAFFIILAPSPTANDFTAARPINDDINALLIKRLDTFLPLNWRDNYSRMVQQAYLEVKGKPIMP